jgi:hypothetical protein
MNARNLQPPSRLAEKNLIVDALSALAEKTGIQGRVARLSPDSPGHDAVDGMVELAYDNGSGAWLVECKSSIDRKAQIDQVRRKLEETGAPGLLVTPYISKELAAHCRATDLQFIDSHGNAYLRAPGLFILISGEKNEGGRAHVRPPKGLTNAAGLRVVFGLLCRPDLVNASFREIARQTGVSLGTAYNALDDLARRGYLLGGNGSAPSCMRGVSVLPIHGGGKVST